MQPPTTNHQTRHDQPELDDAEEPDTHGNFNAHPDCQSLPKISLSDSGNVVNSIDERGPLRPILLDTEGQLVGGRCRRKACHVDPQLPTHSDPSSWWFGSMGDANHEMAERRAAAEVVAMRWIQIEQDRQRPAENTSLASSLTT
ncbi:ParB N-terminal domain-containing protein [Novipirellula artificiosorum]|uniref:Uncharacterized protein n=1 Tax=Novipirellula artificiosorum TaxID=2528016 RepID=A0A5C6D7D0_9BACT|nr:hypothetical protein [Novipirellula artificiosorum]TWU31617.1 hypothetical protein Poly41_61740 [Novipirellula artificiosorum]